MHTSGRRRTFQEIESMLKNFTRAALVACTAIGLWQAGQTASAVQGAWDPLISYQNKNDLFANYYVGPCPSGTAAAMYVSPQPVPAHVGHTYTTYQPLMPHEMLYRHTRSHYAYEQGAGWTRSKVRYRTRGLILQDIAHNLRSGF
jgi:hypothetical protein